MAIAVVLARDDGAGKEDKLDRLADSVTGGVQGEGEEGAEDDSWFLACSSQENTETLEEELAEGLVKWRRVMRCVWAMLVGGTRGKSELEKVVVYM